MARWETIAEWRELKVTIVTIATQLMMLLLLVRLQIRQIHFQTNTNESLLARKENIGAKF